MLYLWIKSLHIIAVVTWMSALLYLPRLFVYHVNAVKGSVQSETFKVMERRLLKAIMNPSMIVVWLTGPWLAYDSGAFHFGWLHTKLLFVIIVSALHGYFAGCVKSFAADANQRPERFYRIMNEIPAALMVLIVILVVVKPF